MGRTVHAGVEAVVGASLALGDRGTHRLEPLVSLTLNHFKFKNDTAYGNNRLPAAPRYAIARQRHEFADAFDACRSLADALLSDCRPSALIGTSDMAAIAALHAAAIGEAAVRLFAPVSGKLGLAEGIESALSAMQLFGIPCWATLGNERFGLVAIPESVRELYLFIDNDAGGALAEERALKAYAAPNRVIHSRAPASSGFDWNDELKSRLARKPDPSGRGEGGFD